MYFMVILMIVFFAFLVVGLPVGLTVQSDTGPGPITYIVGVITVLIFSLAEVILLLVADYARAWLVSSFPMMLILMVIQVLFGCLVFLIIRSWIPGTGGGVFLLFIVSQMLFFIKTLLKAWRYGSVTSLMEMNNQIKV
jgi:hypothetical protein